MATRSDCFLRCSFGRGGSFATAFRDSYSQLVHPGYRLSSFSPEFEPLHIVAVVVLPLPLRHNLCLGRMGSFLVQIGNQEPLVLEFEEGKCTEH